MMYIYCICSLYDGSLDREIHYMNAVRITKHEALQAAGVEWTELQFARAVLQQRLELRRARAQQALRRLVAFGAKGDVVKLRSAVMLARAYGVSRGPLPLRPVACGEVRRIADWPRSS